MNKDTGLRKGPLIVTISGIMTWLLRLTAVSAIWLPTLLLGCGETSKYMVNLTLDARETRDRIPIIANVWSIFTFPSNGLSTNVKQ